MTKDYNNIDWNQYFEYSETSPSGLIWKIDRGKTAKSGQKVGSLINNRYWRVKINNNHFLLHRIIWILHYGSIDPKLYIDHIDGNSSNNKIDNLRLVNRTLNQRNQKKSSKNNSGMTGVRFVKIKGTPYYSSFFCDNVGKEQSKCFNINKYGHDKAFELACKWRENKISEVGGYTERHGK